MRWFVVALVCYARVASADPETDLATARRLFEEGLISEDAKQWATALERFQRVAAIRPTPQVEYNLGICYSKVGKLVLAINAWGRVTAESSSSSDPDLRALAELADKRRAAVEPQIARVVVRVPPHTAVSLDGAPVAPALLGAPLLVDPGSHDFVATSVTGETASRHVEASPGASSEIEIIPPPHTEHDSRPIPPVAFVTTGASLAAFGVAIGMMVWRSDDITTLDAACGSNRQSCPSNLSYLVDRVGTQTLTANILTGVGVAGAVVTAVIILLRPTHRTAPRVSYGGLALTF